MLTRLIAVLLLSTCAFAQKVKIDFDKATDFAKVKSYAWVKGMPVPGPAMDAYIMTSIDQELKNHGMTKLPPEKADVFITYYAAGNTDFNITGLVDPTFVTIGGVPPTSWSVWYSGVPYGSSARQIRKGSLSVQLFDKVQHKLIWNAVAEGTVKEKMDKRLDQLDKITTKMFQDFPPTQK